MIDTHAHLNFEAFKEDCKEVIKRSREGGVEAIINVGAQFKTSEKAIKIAKEHDICFASVGIHPIHTQDMEGMEEKEVLNKLSRLTQNKKVVAIGETGLDYYHLPSEALAKEVQEAQKKLFKIHLKLAHKRNLPVILHCRDAYEDMLEILKKSPRVKRGVIHCFCGDLRIAQEFIDLGFYIGFTGMITYPGNEYLEEVIAKIPLKKILAETDCPYLPPQPKRGKRNESLFVRYVIEKIAKVRGLEFKEVDRATSQNAIKLFKLSI